MTPGAIDNEFADAERSAEAELTAAVADMQREPEQAHNPGKEYAFPRGRLMTVPVWGEDDE